MLTSTVLTLLVIPTFYDILAGTRDRMRRLVGSRHPGASGEPRPGHRERDEAREAVTV